MMRQLFVVPAVLSLVVLGMAVDAAWAQPRRVIRREQRRDMRRGGSAAVAVDAGPVAIGVNRGGAYTYTGDGYTTRSYSYYYTPEETIVTADAPASVRMILPDPKARVWFNGTLTQQTGPQRLFATPTLAAGTHAYTIRATWMDGTREVAHERTINVTPGRTTVVDFTSR